MLAMAHPSSSWTFLSNHGHVLVALTNDSEATMRDIAQQVGITERAVQTIVRDLADAGYVAIRRVGRRNTYAVDPDLPLRHPIEQHTRGGELIALLSSTARS